MVETIMWTILAGLVYLACLVHNRFYFWGRYCEGFRYVILWSRLMPFWHVVYYILAYIIFTPIGTLIILVQVGGRIMVAPCTNPSKYRQILWIGYMLSSPKRRKRLRPGDLPEYENYPEDRIQCGDDF
jgi:hypothetical protein